MFTEQFAFDPHSLVNFVGGGGKTALVHKLMQEFSTRGQVLYTTTTRMHPPDPGEGIVQISGDNFDLLGQILGSVARSIPAHYFKLVVTGSYMSPTLLRGVPADFDNAVDREFFSILLNEADGAAGFSLKMPRDGEPVLMEDAQYLVPVVGIDCLHQPVDASVIFRFEKFLEHFPDQAEEHINSQLASDILMHPQGVCKDWKPGMSIVPFINKVENPEQEAGARDLARRILRNGNFPVDRVLFGSVSRDEVGSIGAS